MRGYNHRVYLTVISMRDSDTLISFYPMFFSPVNHSSTIYNLTGDLSAPLVPDWLLFSSCHVTDDSDIIVDTSFGCLPVHSVTCALLSSQPLSVYLCLITCCIMMPQHNVPGHSWVITPQYLHIQGCLVFQLHHQTMFLGHKSSDTSKGQLENMFVYAKGTKYARL